MFEHLERLRPDGRTYWLELPEVAPGAAIELRFAGESNRPYFNAVLKRAAQRLRAAGGRPARVVSAEAIAQNRAEDRELFPRYVCTGNWRGILDQEGNEVECTPEALREFCAKLPDWLFDRLREAAADPTNFAIEEVDADELAGN